MSLSEAELGRRLTATADAATLADLIRLGLRASIVGPLDDAADRLLALDSGEESVVLRAAVDVALGAPEKALARLERFLTTRPDSARAELARAKALATWAEVASGAERQSRLDRAERGAERALELDPELEEAVYWLATLDGTRRGPPAFARRLARLAERSARAARALGAFRLREGDRAGGLAAFEAALRLGDDVGGVAADLLRAGEDAEVVRLCAARYQPRVHGLPGGVALVTAWLGSGDADRARSLLAALGELAASDDERARVAELGAALAARTRRVVTEREVEGVTWRGPIWAAAGVAAPPDRTRAPTLVLFPWSVTQRGTGMGPGHPEGMLERSARALPLALAERLREAFAIETVSVALVAGREGLYVPSERLPLPVLFAISPPDAEWVLRGQLSTNKAEVDLFSLSRGALVRSVSGAGPDPVAMLLGLEPKLASAMVAARAKRVSARERVPPWVPTAAYLDALAALGARLLVTRGVIDPAQAWNEAADRRAAARAAAEIPAHGARLESALARCLGPA